MTKKGEQKIKKKHLALAAAFAIVVGLLGAMGTPSFAGTTTNTSQGTYQIKYYKQSTNGKYYYLASTVTKKATVGVTVSASIKSYSGYHVNYNKCIRTGKIKSNTVVVLKIYYLKGSGSTTKPVTTSTCKPSTATTCTTTATTCAPVATTCSTVATTCAPVATTCSTVGTTCSTASQKGDATTFKVQHYKQSSKGSSTYNLALTTVYAAKVGDVGEGSFAYFPGYSENQNHKDRKNASIVKANGATIYRLYYDVDTSNQSKVASYQIYDYRETGKGTNTYTLGSIRDSQGVVGTTGSVSLQSWTDYKADFTISGTVKTGTIKADGTLVLKVYYHKL